MQGALAGVSRGGGLQAARVLTLHQYRPSCLRPAQVVPVAPDT
jgi:hypothetical protein